jgi:hypothetical protein
MTYIATYSTVLHGIYIVIVPVVHRHTCLSAR